MRVHQNVIARSNLNAKQKQKAMFALGQDFFAAGMLDRAESVFKELLNNNSKWISTASICASLRTIYEQTQEWEKAVEATNCYKKNQTKNEPENNNVNSDSLIAHYYCELADDALSKGNLHQVDGYVTQAKKSYKQSTRIMVLQGNIAFHQKQYKQASKQYLDAIKHDTRLLGMLFKKLEESANASGEIPTIKAELIKLFKNSKDKSCFEAILLLAKKYSVSNDVDVLLSSTLSTERLNIESIYNAVSYIQDAHGEIDHKKGLELVNTSLSNYLKGVPAFYCAHCGYKMHDYLWRCPACHHWDTIDHA